MSTFSKRAEKGSDTPSHTKNWACLRAILSLLATSKSQSRLPACVWNVATVSAVSITVSCRIRVASGSNPLGICRDRPIKAESSKFIFPYHFHDCNVEEKRRRIRRLNWEATLAILALSASIALADDFKTIRGKKYKNATISRVESDGIVVRTKSGIVKLYFTELPKEVQERFHYDASQASAAATPHQTPMNVAKPTDQAGSTGQRAIEKLQRYNLLRLDCTDPDAKAWIAPAAWISCDAQEKENVTKTLAFYCHPQCPSIWILDKQSGRKLASYGPFRRFEVY